MFTFYLKKYSTCYLPASLKIFHFTPFYARDDSNKHRWEKGIPTQWFLGQEYFATCTTL